MAVAKGGFSGPPRGTGGSRGGEGHLGGSDEANAQGAKSGSRAQNLKSLQIPTTNIGKDGIG